MFEQFVGVFPVDEFSRSDLDMRDAATAEEVVAASGGASFGRGIYRVHSAESSHRIAAAVSRAYPHAGPLTCFGYDWLGRQYATLTTASTPEVIMLEPGTGEMYFTKSKLTTFHDGELLVDEGAVLEPEYFQDWLESAEGQTSLAVGQCVGYRVPLFLGGQDEVVNLEISDLDVYWHIVSQLLEQTRDLPPGSPIGQIDIGD
jgi:hypothetical protein